MDCAKQRTVELWLYGPFVTIGGFVIGLVVAYLLDRHDRRSILWS